MDQVLHTFATGTSVTLWWEKPAAAGPDERYTVFFEGAGAGETTRTHFTFENLCPDSSYCVEVRFRDTVMGAVRVCTEQARRRLDVRTFGAAGDGITMDTAALQAAIDQCGPEGEVYLPAGIYRTGALRLHSDMALYLEEGAVLQGTDHPEDYLPRIPSRFEGIEQACYSSLLNLGELDHTAGPNCRNVLIYGKGTIASGGQALALAVIESERERLRDYLAANAALVATCENDHTIPGRVRPRLINMSNCENIRITGLTLKNGASWNLHMVYSRNIVTDHCTFRSEGVWNGDGWDPDSSEDCTLFACRFFTGDDAVAIKSGKNPEGNAIGRPTRHIRVFDCVSRFGHGIVVGSEMSGGVEDVRVWDCDLGHAMQGIEIKGTPKRGGYVRGLHLRDCTVARVLMHSVGYNDDGIPAPEQPLFEQCSFERVRILGRSLDHDGVTTAVPAIELEGFSDPGHEIRDVVFRDCVLAGGNLGIRLGRCKGVSFENLCCE